MQVCRLCVHERACMWLLCASLSDIDDVPTRTCPTEYGTCNVASMSIHIPLIIACDHTCQ